MTEERLAEIREDLTCAYQGPEWGEINDMAHELLDEIERLRAENERLTAAHRFLLASSYCRKEMGCLTAGFLDLGGHDRFCAVRIAWDALHPEPTS